MAERVQPEESYKANQWENKNTILIFSILLATFVSCKKYEEGPLISFHSAYHRIMGNWKVVSYTVNGIDSMQFIYKNRMDEKWIFDEWGDHHNRVHIEKIISSANSHDFQYMDGPGDNWVLSDDGKTISVYLTHSYVTTTYPYNVYNIEDSIPDWKFNGDWKIIRLKENDMKWRLTDGNIYEIHFKPI